MAAKKKAAKGAKRNSGANVGFEAQLWAPADALWSSMDASEDKHVTHGLIFLNYFSDTFEEPHDRLVTEQAHGPDPEDDRRGELMKSDQRWTCGMPPAGKAHFAWRVAA